MANSLELENITDRPWEIQGCSALTGDGIDQGMEWLSKIIKRAKEKEKQEKDREKKREKERA